MPNEPLERQAEEYFSDPAVAEKLKSDLESESDPEDRQHLEGVRGADMEGLRYISEKWGIKWMWNKRTRQAEIADNENTFYQITPVKRDTLIQHIRTRCKNGNSKDVIFQSKSIFMQAVRALAGENSVDPILRTIQENAKNNPWDGKKRIKYALHECFGTPKTQLGMWASQYPFLAVIQRAYKPGCILQEFPVLIGPGDVGKSTWLQCIIPSGEHHSRWIKEGLTFDPDGKKMYYQTKRSAIVEWGEMKGIRGVDIEALKAWLTATHDIVDEKYEDSMEYARRFVIIGTANPESPPLPNDPAAMRRFVAIDCPNRVEGALQWAKANANQMWSEAHHLYTQEKFRANLPDEFKQFQVESNEPHRYTSDIEALLQAACRHHEDGFTASEAAVFSELASSVAFVGKRLEGEVSRALQSHAVGYYKKRRSINGIQATRYYRTDKALPYEEKQPELFSNEAPF